MTCLYAEVIGDPIAQSKSPVIHGFWLGKLGIDAQYRACHVTSDQVADYLAERRADPVWRGCNVTMPHKQAVMPHLDVLEPAAKGVGAVNTIFPSPAGGLAGTNTDVDGIAEAVAPCSLAGQTAVVLGAGGAARAAFTYLSQAGCSAVKVLARSPDKASAAVAECGLDAQILSFEAGTGAFDGAALLINATQLGMKGAAPLPAFVTGELDRMAQSALVFDMVYSPLDTVLLQAARKLGLQTSDGLTMLIGQAATAFDRFFGQPPPRDADSEAELRALLTA